MGRDILYNAQGAARYWGWTGLGGGFPGNRTIPMGRTGRTVSLCFCICMATAPGCRPETFNRNPTTSVDGVDLVARRLDATASRLSPTAGKPKPALEALPTDLDPPASPSEFRRFWHFKPVNQGRTGHCWSFGATSFFESEMHRLSGRTIKLSELHTVYWEYLEKARRFVLRHGDSEFGRGSEPNAVIRIWRTYGAVPASAYTGLRPGRSVHDDQQLCAEIREYLDSLRRRRTWDEASAMTAVRVILDKHLGPPPASFKWEGRKMTPHGFLRGVVRLNLDDYVSILSLRNEPFNAWCEYKVPDNWWRSREYFNVCLADFMAIVNHAVTSNQSLCMGIDNTEPGFLYQWDLAFVPAFDTPASSIDDTARQIRFDTGSTTDDHVVHLVGVCGQRSRPWYLIKDSNTGPIDGPQGGYMFFRDDYIRLKTLFVLLPREAAERALGRSLGSPGSAWVDEP